MKSKASKIHTIPSRIDTTLVVFGDSMPSLRRAEFQKFSTIVASKSSQKEVENLGCPFVDIDTLVDPGSAYEANIFLEELSSLAFPSGERISKPFLYEGYELWWVHYNDFFHYFCLPYTRYKKLLEYLRNFQNISFYHLPYKNLFSYYLRAYECEVTIINESRFKKLSAVPGTILQGAITFLSLGMLIVSRPRIMLFTGDSLEQSRDYDFRMKFIYEELRQRRLPFIEFIRSLESWKTVIKHAVKRGRPVIYSEAVVFIGHIMSVLFGGRHTATQKFDARTFLTDTSSDTRFRLAVATHYLLGVYDDICAIRIMKLVLRVIGIKAAFIPAATERNFHAVLGCKLNGISTVGILHGAAFRYVTPYDFMDGFTGEKMLSVDTYGVWSEWWKEYYIKYSHAYKPEQLYLSGPMRPLEVLKESKEKSLSQERMRILFVSEQVATPSEVMPYLRELLDMHDVELTIKFRPARDGFEEWLMEHEPQIFKLSNLKIVKGAMQEAIQNADVVVGSYSTGVLEALLQLKVPIFFRTKKWGDYFSMTESSRTSCLFVENPKELSEKINNTRNLSSQFLLELREQYFGDPHKNGSKWVVDRLEKILREQH